MPRPGGLALARGPPALHHADPDLQRGELPGRRQHGRVDRLVGLHRDLRPGLEVPHPDMRPGPERRGPVPAQDGRGQVCADESLRCTGIISL